MRVLLILFLFLIFVPFVGAQTPPVPESKIKALGELEARAQEQEKKQKILETQARTIETALGSTRKQLLKAAHSIQKNEKTLQTLEGKIEDLEKQQSTIQKKLTEDRTSISRLILALERIRRVPPEAMLARPEAPLKTAQSAMLMRDILPALNRQAEALRKNLVDLQEISDDLLKKRQTALKASDALKKEHATLSALVTKREQLYASTQQDLKKRQEAARRISLEARNLQDLVQKLNEEKQRVAARAQSKQAILKTKKVKSEITPRLGQPQLPVSGIVRIAYNQPDNFGAPSKGLTIEGRAGALIVAPMGGTVRFSGHFKNYGNMIILEHEKGFHSLIAGFEKIDTVVGQTISAGEPLGLLNNNSTGQKPTLYYELRQDGKPVNPSIKFADLG